MPMTNKRMRQILALLEREGMYREKEKRFAERLGPDTAQLHDLESGKLDFFEIMNLLRITEGIGRGFHPLKMTAKRMLKYSRMPYPLQFEAHIALSQAGYPALAHSIQKFLNLLNESEHDVIHIKAPYVWREMEERLDLEVFIDPSFPATGLRPLGQEYEPMPMNMQKRASAVAAILAPDISTSRPDRARTFDKTWAEYALKDMLKDRIDTQALLIRRAFRELIEAHEDAVAKRLGIQGWIRPTPPALSSPSA